jgi:phosphatidylglycerophosphate synthase
VVELTDGERWARAELEGLLERRFSPAAVAGFLAASFRRSADVRRARPELARQARRWMAVGAAAWLLPPFYGRARAGLAWWALTSLMLDWHLGMVETPDGRPRPLSGADALTLARAWLVPLAACAPTPAVTGAAALTDVLDGALARRGEPTRAGRDLEGLVDACFGAAALRGALRHGAVAPAAVGAELARLGAGFGYALVVYFGRADAGRVGRYHRVTRAARLTTPVRAAALIAAGLGRRRLASALLAAGSAWSIVSLVYGVRRG